MTVAPRQQLADELLRRLAAALRSAQLYSAGHPIITRNLDGLIAAINLLHTLGPSIVIGLVGEEIIVDDLPFYFAWYRPFLHAVKKKFIGYVDSAGEYGVFSELETVSISG